MSHKKIIIVGGGYIGASVAKSLQSVSDVTLIEPREQFVHAPAMLRSLVEPEVLEKALISYDAFLSSGHLIHQRALSVDETGVTITDGSRLSADYTVIATGSTNGSAFKPQGEDLVAFRAAQSELSSKIRSARSIVIVGAGAVGTELAGEIISTFPTKRVCLISSDGALFPSMPRALGQALLRKLQESGVVVRLGARANSLKSTTQPYEGVLTLSTGEELGADLIIPAIGSRPVTDLITHLPGATINTTKRVIVDRYMRPSSLSNVFAAGDAVDAGDGMTIVAADRQSKWLSKTLISLSKGKQLDVLKPYEPWKKPPILIPLGPERGNSFLGLGTFGDWVTSKMKGRDLFIPKYVKLLNG